MFDLGLIVCKTERLKMRRLQHWLSKRNSSPIHFLKGIAGNDGASISLVQHFQCIEHIYHLGNAKFISPPIAFSKNLMFYKTGSNGSVLVNSAGSPSGSYTSLQNWIKSYSKQSLACVEIIFRQ
ncbi:Hypothetical predicted protein [Mytilus galloprovincialis]|uniref:Uncharacterized protein n=1 Tax=Mytilus galloprovincialis TaxID=29158 RepID=A0A8B6EUG4_MYTGA|nr:Hypothetical predicted protein [Mytilus galloprovincialis]